MSANFCPAHGLCSSVKSIVGNVLTLADEDVWVDLCTTLSAAPGKYTRLMLSTGVGWSEFKVTCVNDCLKLFPTPPAKFASGDRVWYESCSADNIADLMACVTEAEEGEDETGGFPKLPGYEIVQNDEGEWCYEPEEGQQKKVSWQDGKNLLTMGTNGIITCDAAPAGSYPTEGEYSYATVTVGSDCKVTEVKPGTKPVSGSCGTGCCCKECTEAVVDAGAV